MTTNFTLSVLKCNKWHFQNFLQEDAPRPPMGVAIGPLIIIHHQQCYPSGPLKFKFSLRASKSCGKNRCQRADIKEQSVISRPQPPQALRFVQTSLFKPNVIPWWNDQILLIAETAKRDSL